MELVKVEINTLRDYIDCEHLVILTCKLCTKTIVLGCFNNCQLHGLCKIYVIFISVFNQLDVQNLFHNKFYFMPLHVSSTCAHHQEVKIVYTASGIITPIGMMIPEAV